MRAPLCLLVSIGWSTLSALARVASRLGWPRRIRLPVRVISVGNIQAGGSGKTPLVARIAREAIARGLRVVILTRGYRSPAERAGEVVAAGAESPSSLECGDEAVLLHERAPGAWIAIGADRAAAFKRAVAASGGFDLAILDDGFQNRRLHKDLEVVAVTGARPWQKPFREWAGALKRADLLVWTKGATGPRGVVARYELPRPVETPQNGPDYWMVTGLGDGAEAVRAAQAAGWKVVRYLGFRDHERYDREQVRRILTDAVVAGVRVLLTGKDWVKWREHGVVRAEVDVIEPEVRFVEGEELWNRALWGR